MFSVYDSGGPAVLGLAGCLQAASIGSVRALVVEDGVSAAGVVCEACGWLGLRGQVCAACECPVRRSDDIVEELIESVVDQGGSARRIRVGTALRGWDVAAALHFAPRGDVYADRVRTGHHRPARLTAADPGARPRANPGAPRQPGGQAPALALGQAAAGGGLLGHRTVGCAYVGRAFRFGHRGRRRAVGGDDQGAAALPGLGLADELSAT